MLKNVPTKKLIAELDQRSNDPLWDHKNDELPEKYLNKIARLGEKAGRKKKKVTFTLDLEANLDVDVKSTRGGMRPELAHYRDSDTDSLSYQIFKYEEGSGSIIGKAINTAFKGAFVEENKQLVLLIREIESDKNVNLTKDQIVDKLVEHLGSSL